eukprot:TRINITY_DN5564_c0_g1_i3.p1 TRINITY_DN5564_c0_g1~~TRINITY_DN5564_c0_g1_i3.p1  ORF type:complete len:619 (+),score=80.31 TRINITY_DN5564_c0_g1_i3:75-1931(+)
MSAKGKDGTKESIGLLRKVGNVFGKEPKSKKDATPPSPTETAKKVEHNSNNTNNRTVSKGSSILLPNSNDISNAAYASNPELYKSWFQECAKLPPSLENLLSMLAQGVNINVQDPSYPNGTGLHLLCKNSANESAILTLLAKGANSTIPDVNLNQPLHDLVKHPTNPSNEKSFETIIDALLESKGANINAQNKHQETALLNAVNHSNITMVNFLLVRKADVNITNKWGSSVLHLSVVLQKLPLVERFLQEGVDPLKRGGKEDETALETGEKSTGVHAHRINELLREAVEKRKRFGTASPKPGYLNNSSTSSNNSMNNSGDRGLSPYIGSTESNGKASWEVEASEIEGTLQTMGSGGFGVVYKARFRRTDVAVKMLEGWKHCEGSQRMAILSDFRREVNILAKLRNKNIIQFYGACLDIDHDIFLLTEFADNGDLYRYLKNNKGNISWETRLRFMLDSARGLVYLHESKPCILHRDLKSLNILIDSHMVAKLCDFGLSKDTTELTTPTDQRKLGSLKWIAPELFAGAEQSTASDIYAFGVVMWEAATMREPWEKMNAFIQIITSVTSGRRPEILPDEEVDGDYRKIMEECWRGNPTDRPNMVSVLDRIEALYNNLVQNK